MIAITVVAVLGFMVNSPLREERRIAFHTTGILVLTVPYLTIQVSPPGYPQIGEFWTINVFVVNSTSSHTLTYEPASNTTVVIILLMREHTRTYELPVDGNGKVSFQYLLEYSDISFQAYHPDLSSSQKIILSINYVPSSVVDSLLIFNFFSVLGSLGSSLLFRVEKTRKAVKWAQLQRWLLMSILCLFSFVTTISLYSKLFQKTVWGYPENIVNGFITFTLLRYIFFSSVVIFVLYWIGKLIIIAIHKTRENVVNTRV